MKKHLLLIAVAAFSLEFTAQVQRMALYEEFTGENCGPCAATNPALDALLAQPANNTRLAAIKWQVPIPSAPSKATSLYQTNKTEIDWRYRSVAQGGYGYAINSAPSGKMDGQNVTVFGASSNHPGNLNNSVITNAVNVSAPFSITMARAWNSTATAITLTITVQAASNFNAVGNLVFRTVMIERKIEFDVAPGSNGEKIFHDVAIKSFPSIQNGTSLPSNWTTGQTQTFTLNCVIPSYARDKTQIAFVGFIQDDGDRKVHQAYRADKEGFPYDASALTPKVPTTCTTSLDPIVTVKNTGLNTISSLTITPYVNGTAANITTWNGSLAPGAETTISLDPVPSPSGTGVHTFSYTITGMDNTDFEPANNGNSTQFMVVEDYNAVAVQEGFVGSFPPADWAVIGDSKGKQWIKNSGVGAYGLSTESAMLSFYTSTKVGDAQELMLPPVDYSGNEAPILDFVYAHSQKAANDSDTMRILASTDCGNSWTKIFERSGNSLASVFTTTNTTFIPEPHQWRQESITLNNFNSPTLLLKFVGVYGGGNNLYLDDINLRQPTSVGIKEEKSAGLSATLFPNPSSGNVQFAVTSPLKTGAVIRVSNNLGQLVSERTVQLSEGQNSFVLDLQNEASGIYHVSLESDAGSFHNKITLTH